MFAQEYARTMQVIDCFLSKTDPEIEKFKRKAQVMCGYIGRSGMGERERSPELTEMSGGPERRG